MATIEIRAIVASTGRASAFDDLEDAQRKLRLIQSMQWNHRQRITNAIAREVDRLEDELQKMIPELKFLDFEGDAPTGHTQVLTPPKP